MGNRMAKESKKKEYEVGYGKPPKETQFKKGQPSANPKGRPKGSKSWKTLLDEELNREITISVNGKPEKVTMKQAIVRREVQKALVDGDLKNLATIGAFKEVEEAREYPLKFTLDLDSPPPANDWEDNDFDYSQPQLKPGGSTVPE